MGHRKESALLRYISLEKERYDSTMFHNNIVEPEIEILDLRKVYYINETFMSGIRVKKVPDCEVNAKLSVVEEEDGKTQFWTNLE